MRATSFLLALACASVIAVTATSANACSYGGYDFSSLSNADLLATDTMYRYYIRPCGVLSESSCLATAATASACQVQYNPSGASWVTALNNNPTWGLLPNNQGAFYNETGVQACWATGSPTDYYTNVEFVCSTSTSLVSVAVNLCTQTYTIATPLACSVAPPSPPAPSSSCGFAGLDFSSLMGTDYQGSDGGSTYAYYLSVCGGLKSQPSCTSVAANAAACQEQVQPKGASWVNGVWQGPSSTSWYYIDPSNPSQGVGYLMAGTQSCWATGSPTFYYAHVNFVCSETAGAMTVIDPPLSCVLNYTIPTPLACGGSPPPPPPPPSTSCGFSGMDFSSLKGRDFVGSDGGSVYQYFMSVCGPLTTQPQCTAIQTNSANCQVQVNPRGASYDTGNWPSSGAVNWYLLDPGHPEKGAGYQITGAQSCWASGSPTDYIANVKFECAEAEGPVTVTQAPLSCVQNYTLPTPLACGIPPTPPPCRASIDGNQYDLSPITKSDLIWQYSPSEVFALRVCGSVTTSGCASLPSTTSACLASPSATYDMGNDFPIPGLPNLQYIDPSQPNLGVTYQLIGDSTCQSEPGRESNWVANVELLCGSAQGALSVSSVGACTYNWSISTPVGCPPGHTFETQLPLIATE